MEISLGADIMVGVAAMAGDTDTTGTDISAIVFLMPLNISRLG